MTNFEFRTWNFIIRRKWFWCVFPKRWALKRINEYVNEGNRRAQKRLAVMRQDGYRVAADEIQGTIERAMCNYKQAFAKVNEK